MSLLPTTEAEKQDRPSGPLAVDAVSLSPGDDISNVEDEEFIDGFSWKTVIGALFIGFIMMPGSIYLGLIAGQGMGPAAEWVTIILFMEIARRSYQSLKKQEIYLLYYIGAALTSNVAGIAISGGPFALLIWNSYVVHTPIARALGITSGVPNWVSPSPDSPGILGRTFFHADWLPAIGLLMFGQLFGRMTSWGLGYVLFRLTSDVERLPFPLAPIAAEGATALAESSAQKEGWRWRIFSIGAMMGVGWGALYILLPAVTGLIFSQPITLVSIPFIDYTQNTQKILPGALTGIGTDPGQILIGFLLPFAVVIGIFVSSIGCHIIANPFLQKAGILKNWVSGTDMLQSQLVNGIDFWLSFGIGTSAVVAIIGIASVIRALAKARAQKQEGVASPQLSVPKGRGDFPIWLSLLVFAIGTVAYIWMCKILVPDFPLWMLIFFGFVWTPIFSYINARMAGLAGQSVSIPYVREASFMLSRYQAVDIWFAPIPLADHGGMAQHFKTVELTRTKFSSIIKVEALMLPIMLGCSLELHLEIVADSRRAISLRRQVLARQRAKSGALVYGQQIGRRQLPAQSDQPELHRLRRGRERVGLRCNDSRRFASSVLLRFGVGHARFARLRHPAVHRRHAGPLLLPKTLRRRKLESVHTGSGCGLLLRNGADWNGRCRACTAG